MKEQRSFPLPCLPRVGRMLRILRVNLYRAGRPPRNPIPRAAAPPMPVIKLVRVTRFELVSPLWKSGVLPLNDTRVPDAHTLAAKPRGVKARLRPFPNKG